MGGLGYRSLGCGSLGCGGLGCGSLGCGSLGCVLVPKKEETWINRLWVKIDIISYFQTNLHTKCL